MTVLVLGANGLLGSNVLAKRQSRGYDILGTHYQNPPSMGGKTHELDIRDRERVAEILDLTDPDLVLNCAAMTDVDGCESSPETAEAINGTAPGTIAAACAERSIAFTHVSTDYVFDGTTSSPYDEDAEPNPVQVYGETKLAGERAVREHHPKPTIVRLSFVYGIHRGDDELVGFPAWVRSRLREGTETPVFIDQHVSPTRAGQAADTLLDLHERDRTGTYHVASRSCVTPHEFGREICTRMKAPASLLVEGELSDVDREATRPHHTCLAVDAVEAVLDRSQPTLATDLDQIFREGS